MLLKYDYTISTGLSLRMKEVSGATVGVSSKVHWLLSRAWGSLFANAKLTCLF